MTTSKLSPTGLRSLLAIATLLATTAAAGCGSSSSSTERSSSAAASASAGTPSTSGSADNSESVEPDPTSATQGQDPVAAAQKIWTAWSSRDLSYDQWWAQLLPMLAPAAQAAYANTDPRNIPALQVTGQMTLDPVAPDVIGYTALVHVPTSLGDFGLNLERHTASGPWLLEAINFPKGVH